MVSLRLVHVSAAEKIACRAANFDVVGHLLGVFHFFGLVEGRCAPNTHCNCSCQQDGCHHSRTLIEIPFAFIILIFILFVFCFFRFDDAKVRAKSSLSYFSFLFRSILMRQAPFLVTNLRCPLLICRKKGYFGKNKAIWKKQGHLEKNKAILEKNKSYFIQ